MYPGDGRVAEPQAEDLNKLTLAKVRRAVSAQLRPQDLEINMVGDFLGKTQHKLADMEGGLSTGKHRDADEVGDAVEPEVPAVARERRLRELDEAVWKYLGSLPPSDVPQAQLNAPPLICNGDELPA